MLAIDQPLHGIAAISTTEQKTLAERILAGGGIISPDGSFDGVDSDPADQGAIDLVQAGGFGATTGQSVALGIQEFCPAISITDPANPDPNEINTAIAAIL